MSRGFVRRNPVWLMQPLGVDTVRKQAATMEIESRRFYESAAKRARDPWHVRQLLDDLASEERSHESRAEELEKEKLGFSTRKEEDEAGRRLFVLQIVQPGLAGLMDGSVSTLAPVFAAAFATHKSWDAFLVGLAASKLGAGIRHGLRGSTFRRREPDRARTPLDARTRLWVDDGTRRHWPHSAVSDTRISKSP